MYLAILNTSFLDAKETNTRAIERLLILAQENPSGAFPQDISDSSIKSARIEYYLPSNPKCWTFLQQAVAQNSNQYLIAAFDNGLNSNFRDVDNSIVQIDFPDVGSAKMVFYQGALVGCEIINKSSDD